MGPGGGCQHDGSSPQGRHAPTLHRTPHHSQEPRARSWTAGREGREEGQVPSNNRGRKNLSGTSLGTCLTNRLIGRLNTKNSFGLKNINLTFKSFAMNKMPVNL